jgi:hypothetical protein
VVDCAASRPRLNCALQKLSPFLINDNPSGVRNPKHDIGGALRYLCTLVRYMTRWLRVKDWQHRDEICRIIYEECLRIDAHFADTALTIGCAF